MIEHDEAREILDTFTQNLYQTLAEVAIAQQHATKVTHTPGVWEIVQDEGIFTYSLKQNLLYPEDSQTRESILREMPKYVNREYKKYLQVQELTEGLNYYSGEHKRTDFMSQVHQHMIGTWRMILNDETYASATALAKAWVDDAVYYQLEYSYKNYYNPLGYEISISQQFVQVSHKVWPYLLEYLKNAILCSSDANKTSVLETVYAKLLESDQQISRALRFQGDASVKAQHLIETFHSLEKTFEPVFTSSGHRGENYLQERVCYHYLLNQTSDITFEMRQQLIATQADSWMKTHIGNLLGFLLARSPQPDSDEIQQIYSLFENYNVASIALPLLEKIFIYIKQQPPSKYLLAVLRRSSDYYLIDQYKKNWENFADPQINPGEVWSDKMLDELSGLDNENKKKWYTLIAHIQTTKLGMKPKNDWIDKTQAFVETIGSEAFKVLTLRCLSLANRSRMYHLINGNSDRSDPNLVFDKYNANVLVGLIWCFTFVAPSPEIARLMAQLVETALKKVPGTGPRNPKIASAAVYILSQMDIPESLAQLVRLKTRVTFKTTLKEIEKALDAAAKKAGISKADLEEMGIPSFGLEPGGVRREMLGETRVELRVLGNEVTLSWFDSKDKQLKNPPASVKKDYAEDLKELKAAQKDISGMLSSLSTRLDNLFLAQKNWPFKIWHERYLEHPLMGTIARRLIWNIDGKAVTGVDGKLVNLKDEALEFSDDATVTLWHPIQATLDDIVAWREWFERHRVTQPFKQAHREVYVLTDAEIRTRVYSNRFAAHILKQHQFNALCALRGWKNKLRLMVDDSYPPASLELPQWNLRVEFWIEGAGTNYGTDTNETGTYLYLSTDQVRFYQIGVPENSAHAGGGGYEMWLRNGAEPVQPLTLEQIPALVFSEVMRDVDMFVGVCSVGNDATWQDGGPQGRYRDYWQTYSFGELNATAETRKALLSKLIPRLKIADRCKLEGRFLWVRGDMRSYKIHLGSSNILMEPNDQYLCIVPSQSSEAFGGKVFLPFEGDRMLSVILSKAFLLAEDTKIADTTITRQIKSGNWN